MKITKVHVTVEAECCKCGGPCRRMTLADFDEVTQRIHSPESPREGFECNACLRAERDAEEEKYRRRSEQSKWANGNPTPPRGPNGGRRKRGIA